MLEAVNGCIDFGKRKFLDYGSYAVTGTKLQHECRGGWTSEWGTGERTLPHNERERIQCDRFGNSSDCVQAPLGSKCRNIRHPLKRDGDSADDEIKSTRFRFQSFAIAGVNNAMGAELGEFVYFIGRGGKGCDLASPLIEKLNCKVAKSASTDDSDSIGRSNMKFKDGTENCNATAKERACAGGGESIGKANRPSPVGSHEIRESAMATYDSTLTATA